jgi:hypothetical protein
MKSTPALSRIGLALALALTLACVSTAPALAPDLEALVDESQNLEGLLNRYSTVEGNERSSEGYTTFRAWFEPKKGLLIVKADTKDIDGNRRQTFAYYRNDQPFYGVEWQELQFSGKTELQVFLAASGNVIGSRSERDGALAAMPEGEPGGLAQRLHAMKDDAFRARAANQ